MHSLSSTGKFPSTEAVKAIVVYEKGENSSLPVLRSELQRIKFEEEQRKKTYNDSRQRLQESWNKLFSLRQYIERIDEEIDVVTREANQRSAESNIWAGNVDIPYSQSTPSFPTTSYTNELKQNQYQLSERQQLQNKIVSIQHKLQEQRNHLHKYTQLLKDSSQQMNMTNLLLNHTLGSNQDGINKSMDIRQQVLQTSLSINTLEQELQQTMAQLETVQEQIEHSIENQAYYEDMTGGLLERKLTNVSNTIIPPCTPLSSANNPMIGSQDHLLSLNRDIITNGIPFTNDFQHALVYATHLLLYPIPPPALPSCIAPQPAGGMLKDSDYLSYEEVMNGYNEVYRINGELPPSYLTRLYKRRLILYHIEKQGLVEVQEGIVQIKQFREVVSSLLSL